MKIKNNELGLRDAYLYYKQNTENPLSYKKFKSVYESYIEEVVDLIMRGENYKIPSKLGYFRIRKYKTNLDKLAKDYKTSKELGTTIYHLNEHSDGYRIKFLWQKSRAILKKDTKRPYSFVPSRDIKRNKLAMIMKTSGGHMRYPEEILNQRYNPL